ncbi:MAG TPA: FixH family protein [Pelomicrobium sp.]|nr:FixH family protein [Pelomicrobium sp.]
MTRRDDGSHPWYREPWVWGLISGPAIVVVAGFITAWLAVRSNDGLVVEDYYKRGLAIHQVLERDQAALRRGLAARVELKQVGGEVVLALASASGALPERLNLSIVHPTRSGYDQHVALSRSGGERYQGAMAPVRAGRWVLTLEDGERTWRLMGSIWLPDQASAELKPAVQPKP